MAWVLSPWLAYIGQALLLFLFMSSRDMSGSVGPGSALLCLSLVAASTAVGYWTPKTVFRSLTGDLKGYQTIVINLCVLSTIPVILGNLLLLGRIVQAIGLWPLWNGLLTTAGFPVQLQLNYGHLNEQASVLYSIAPLAAALSALAWKKFGSKVSLILLLLVLGLQFARAIVWAERLAFIEVIVPAVMVYLSGVTKKISIGRLLGIVLLIAVAGSVFVLGEVTRSTTGLTALETLHNYYGQSVKNFGHLVENGQGGISAGYWTFKPVLNLPILGPLAGLNDIFERITGFAPLTRREHAFSFAYRVGVDPLYNTYTMYGFLYLDFGWGFLLMLVAVGFFTGLAWRQWSRGQEEGYVFYPLLYLNILDSLRTWYVGTDRFTYSLVFGTLFLMAIKIVAGRRNGGELT